MHYIVDGYNLIFRLLHSSRPLQEQREKVVHDLSEKAHILNLSMTVVFDSSFQTGESTRSHLHDMEIIYTAEHESADDFIINLLKVKNKNQTVVTSDQRLAWRARRHSAKTENVEDFVRWLNKRYQNKKLVPQPKIPPLPPPVTTKPSPVPVPKILPGKTAEESFEFYLQTFESNVPPQKSRAKKSITSQRVESPPKKILETENDRWLRLFENNDS